MSAIDALQQTPNPPQRKRRKGLRIFLISLLVVVLVVIGVGAWFTLRVSGSANRMFVGGGNVLDVITDKGAQTQLQEDANHRTNILIFGNSSDEAGHGGALLADSIMVMSIAPGGQDAELISIPRDLWVQYPEPCAAGSSGKINATYTCAYNATSGDLNQASLALTSKVSEITGLEIPYYVQVNYTFLRTSVDALGGIDVTVDSADSRGIYDVNQNLRLPNGVNHLDGAQALSFARARGSEGGYGLARSNFDRELNQQTVVRAIQAKAGETGTLANPVKVVNLIDSLGDNVRTNIATTEIQDSMDTLGALKSDTMNTVDLYSSTDPLVKTGTMGAASVVLPTAGDYDYSQIQAAIAAASAASAAGSSGGQ
ncbi:LCP family protein [Micrococcales bacterium 31B]|nr:LCP family protein [Micrococcales bacterium 31B]